MFRKLENPIDLPLVSSKKQLSRLASRHWLVVPLVALIFIFSAVILTLSVSASPSAVCATPWVATNSYGTANTMVSHNGKNWKNQWWANPGEEPGVNTVWLDQGVCTAATATPVATPDPNRKVRIFYFPEWGVYGRDYWVDDIVPYVLAGQITHIQYAFIDLKADGSCALYDGWAAKDKPGQGSYTQLGNLNQLAALRDDYPNQLDIVLSIGGWTLSDNFSAVAASSTKLATMASSCVAMMREYRFDGLDIDWEYMGTAGEHGNFDPANDGNNFITMIQTLRTALTTAGTQDGKQYLLTAAVGVGEDKFKMFPMGTASQYLDYMSIMSYDMNGAWQELPAHNAPLFANPNDPRPTNTTTGTYNIDYAIDMYLNGGTTSDGTVVEGGVPANKLVIGLPFYGRSWVNVPSTQLIAGLPGLFTTSNNGPNIGTSEPDYQNMLQSMWDGSVSPGTLRDSVGNASGGSWEESVFDFDDIKLRLLPTGGYTRYWDADSMVPYAYNPNVSGGTLVSYDDAESICYKAKYAAYHNLAGVMVWDMTQNSESGNDDLYDAISTGLAGGSSLCPLPFDMGTVTAVTLQNAAEGSQNTTLLLITVLILVTGVLTLGIQQRKSQQ